MKNQIYLTKLQEQQKLKLIIMGKDPYPTAPNGIPFCKPSWDELCAKNCSGKYVLESLGFDTQSLRKIFSTPVDFFLHLLVDQGIGFLNLTYVYNQGKPITKIHNSKVLNEAFAINEPILNKSDNIILCGEAEKLRWLSNSFENKSLKVVHPDLRCRKSRYFNVRNGWLEIWSPNLLKNRFNL